MVRLITDWSSRASIWFALAGPGPVPWPAMREDQQGACPGASCRGARRTSLHDLPGGLEGSGPRVRRWAAGPETFRGASIALFRPHDRMTHHCGSFAPICGGFAPPAKGPRGFEPIKVDTSKLYPSTHRRSSAGFGTGGHPLAGGAGLHPKASLVDSCDIRARFLRLEAEITDRRPHNVRAPGRLYPRGGGVSPPKGATRTPKLPD